MIKHIKITPVILAGGSGTRLWPMSRGSMPKQFCKIADEQSLFQKTLARVANKKIFNAPIIVSGERHKDIINAQLHEVNIKPKVVIYEPMGKDTAPAIALAVFSGDDVQDDVMLVMPSDHLIEEQDKFEELMSQASYAAADAKSILTFGIKPTHPDTGFGYIRAGDKRGALNIHELDIFIEKPELKLAEELIQDPNIFWNAGIFMFHPNLVQEEIKSHTPDLFLQVKTAMCHGNWSEGGFTPDAWLFDGIKPISFDYAIMEKTDHALLVKADVSWSDMGGWNAVWEQGEKNQKQNSTHGEVYCKDVQNSLIMSDGPAIAVSGLDDIVVVAQDDAILVTTKDQSQNLKKLVDHIKPHNTTLLDKNSKQTPAWGEITQLHKDEICTVSKLKILPRKEIAGRDFSSGHKTWSIVSGHPVLAQKGSIKRLFPNQLQTIKEGDEMCLINASDETVEVIEILHVQEPRSEQTTSFEYHPEDFNQIFAKPNATVSLGG